MTDSTSEHTVHTGVSFEKTVKSPENQNIMMSTRTLLSFVVPVYSIIFSSRQFSVDNEDLNLGSYFLY